MEVESKEGRSETFMMDGCEHTIGDPNCCGSFGEACTHPKCSGIMHYQPVYGGYYYKCDKCGRIK